ncbi:MAG: hypothetical protein JWP97_1635 [Labilithrix sp.]|nr:hypothetical protein [Labilithrix sp.]
MLTRFRHLFGVLFFLLVASCSGGGCSSGCSSCAGMTPLPGGFPKDQTIENAATVRVSRPGLDFVEKQLPAIVTKLIAAPGGILGVDIPTIDPPKTQIANIGIGKILIDPAVCPDGPDPKANPPRCHAEVNIGGATFQIDSIKPNAVKLRGVLPVKLENTPVAAEVRADPIIGGEFGIGTITLFIGYGDGGCNDGKPQVTPHALPIGITIPLVEETTSPRNGYMKIDIDKAEIDLSALSTDDVKVCSSCGFASEVCSAITNAGFVKGLVVDPLKNGLTSQVKTLLADSLCTAPNPALVPSCPTNTSPDASNTHCVFDSDKTKCVSTLLGTDSHVNLGGLLKSISPGTTGGLDFGLAAGGSMKPFPNADANAQGRTPNGITLGMLGGTVPQPVSKCVPFAELTKPTGIPLPDELAPTTADPATAPHVGLALSGRFLDYAFGSVYNSGLLCLGVSSEQIDMLRSALLSIIIPSLKTLTFEQGDAAAAITTRPQAPPTVKIGGGTGPADPLLGITLPKFALDFYLWHLDRFVRVFTFESDLTIPVNLQTSKAGITPALGDIVVQNGKVTNADMLMDDPGLVAGALSGLLGGLGKQLVGSGFSPIDVSTALSTFGLGLDIGQIGKLTKGTDDFVGIFATMSKTGGAATMEADTQAVLVSKTVPAEHMQLATMDRASLPELTVDLASPQANSEHPVEYAWWIDRGTRSTWSRERHLVVKDDQLLLQGRHVLHVAARVAGRADTEDATPAEVPFVIDAVAPFVTVKAGTTSATTATLQAWDLVSADSSLVARYRLDAQPFGEWRAVRELAQLDVGHAETVTVEVKDEEGNVRSVTQELRGRADGSLAAAGSGCGCSTPGGRDRAPNGYAAAALAVLGLAFMVLRRRSAPAGAAGGMNRTLLAIGSIGVVAASSQGCSCGSDSDDQPVLCGADCKQECQAPLELGLPGSYTSLAKAADGTIWVAGYNDALLSEGESDLFGDLVVGKYDLGKQRVDWQTVDGLPPPRTDGTCAARAKDSWRNGEVDAGDDVGLWTSLQLAADGRPMVSYYDATNKKLKFAVGSPAEGGYHWNTFTLREAAGADVGRYAKMLVVGGKPVVAFLQVEAGAEGKTRSRVVVARANSEVPADGSDFRFEDAAVEESNPCGATTCTGGQVCLKTTGTCTATTAGCTPADCGSGKACVATAGAATCEATKSGTQTYPDVFGDFITLAQGGGKLGIVVYDRPHGNLVALADQGGGTWTRTVLDGETGSRTDGTAIDTGDVGVAASLQIDDGGTWHVTYVSGLDETLRYLAVTAGKPGKSEIIDDGSGVDGKPFPDGKHLVGDDSALRVDGDLVTVYYQDVTVGQLRRASGTKSGAGHTWSTRALAQDGKFAGYFPQIVPGEDKVANFWEQTDRASHSRVGDVTIVTP